MGDMGATIAMTDLELVEASRRGERDAFGRLVARYQDVVWAVSYSSTGNRTLGEDVAQETFIAAWRQLGQLRDAVQIGPWLCGIARNLARKARRRTWREELDDTADVSAGTAGEAEAEQRIRSRSRRSEDLRARPAREAPPRHRTVARPRKRTGDDRG